MSNKCPITTQGYARLEQELKERKTTIRAKITEEVAAAREHGDLKENAEYHAAREKQSFNEGRIAELEDMVARAEVIDIEKMAGDNTVKFGATVELFDEDADKEVTYTIVGEYEANIDKGLISIASPIARGLIGKTAEDYTQIKTPRGLKGYEVISIVYKNYTS